MLILLCLEAFLGCVASSAMVELVGCPRALAFGGGWESAKEKLSVGSAVCCPREAKWQMRAHQQRYEYDCVQREGRGLRDTGYSCASNVSAT